LRLVERRQIDRTAHPAIKDKRRLVNAEASAQQGKRI
jgi:hypothetical protein